MKLTAILFLVTSLQVAANAWSQTVTLSVTNAPLSKVFKEIRQQTGYYFIYEKTMLEKLKNVDIQVTNVKIETVLDICFARQLFTYSIVDKYIVIKEKPVPEVAPGDGIYSSIDVHGWVRNVRGEMLASATIGIRGVRRVVKTDENGEFNLKGINPDAVLVISYEGYKGQEIPVQGRTSITITLQDDIKTLNNMVVIGYGSVQKSAVTGAVATIKGSEIAGQPVLGFDQAMVGKAAGVQVIQSNGTPGNTATFRVRGVGSITAGNDPLIVLDGVPLGLQSVAFSTINVNDIASIDVLKDASSAAIYGSRGASGVILITSKSGEAGKLSISYSNYFGEHEITKKISMMNAYQYAQLSKDGHDNAYLDLTPGGNASDPDASRPQSYEKTPPELYPYINGVKGLNSTDWQDAIYRKAGTMSHNLVVSGGSDKVKFYVSGNYLDDNGIILNSGYKRYSTRFNLDMKDKKFKFGINISPSFSTTHKVNSDDNYSNYGIVSSALQYTPIWTVYNPDGSYNFQGNGYWRLPPTDYQHNAIMNPVAVANLIKDNLFSTNLIGRIFGEYEFIRGLSYNISLGGSYQSTKEDYYRPSTLPLIGQTYYTSPSNPTAKAISGLSYDWVVEQTLRYKTTYKDHHLTLLAGYSAQRDYASSNSVTATNFPNDLVQTVNGGQVSSLDASVNEWSVESLFGRLQYDYQNKYFLTASVRTDGSSRFGANNKWGDFPSVGAAWNLAKEKFFPELPFVSNLKLRGSYGLTGNFNIGNYQPVAQLGNDNYILGSGTGTQVSGLALNNVANPDLGWEKTTMLDLGADIGLFNQALTLELDYYNSNTQNLLLNLPIPATTGFLTATQNIGKVNNHGLEATLSFQKKAGDFNIRLSGNISANRNKVVALGPGNTPIIQTGGNSTTYFITEVGKPIGSYYLLKQVGIYKTAADLVKYPSFPNSHVGDYRFAAIDTSSQRTGVLDVDKDRTIVGKYLPDYTFGFSASVEYHGFDLSASVQGSEGFQIINLNRSYIDNMEGNTNNMIDGVNRWRSASDPGNGQVSRANRKATGNNERPSSLIVEDGSFIRLSNLTIGYNLSDKAAKKIYMNRLRFYVSGQNIYTWTKYSGYNPEVNNYGTSNALTPGIDYGSYPLAKTFVVGMSIGF